MRTNFYIIVSVNGDIEARKVRGTMSSGQRCIEMNLEIPDTFFRQADLSAKIVVKDTPQSTAVLTIEPQALKDWLK